MKGSHLLKYITDKKYRFKVNIACGVYNRLSDEEFLQRRYKMIFNKELNLKAPETFNEKLQWLKLYDRKPIYTEMVDKYYAKKYVTSIAGEEYIIPTLGIWDSFDEIDFKNLPNQFVLKCTHDSGGIVICKDKKSLDIRKTKKKINQSLRRNYYYLGREWPYKNVKPRIIAEKYLEDTSENLEGNYKKQEVLLKDYKLQCFNGSFDHIFVAEGRFSRRGTRYHYFDRDWNYLSYCPYEDVLVEDLQNLKPKCYDEMIHLAETLSRGLPELRVDLYEVSGKVYFGEMTFYSQSGFDTDITEEADLILGKKLILPGFE